MSLAFDALPIPGTPAVRKIIVFLREAYTPCIYIPAWLRQSPDAQVPPPALIKSRALAGSCGVLRDLQNCVDFPEVQPAWMASNLSAVMSIVPPEDKPHLHGVMLQCRQRSVQLLRQAIRRQTMSDSAPAISVLLQIMLLFREGYIKEHPQGLEAYDVVSQYVKKANVDMSTAFNVLGIAMYNDAESACKSLKRTIFDFKNWLAEQYQPFWAHAENCLPPAAAHVVTDLHPSIANFDHVIRGAILRLRRCLDLSETVSPLAIQTPDDYVTGDLRWAWLASTGLHDMGLLVNQYCDLTDTRDAVADKQACWNHDLRTAVTLTILFNMRKLIHEGSCNGVDLREAPMIIPTMEIVLKRALKSATEEQQWQYRDLLMWIFFTGAWHGQNVHYQRQHSVFGDGSTTFAWPKEFDAVWFNKQLSAQACLLRLTKWYDARALLKRFVCSDLMRPHPVKWYENIVTTFSPEETKWTFRGTV